MRARVLETVPRRNEVSAGRLSAAASAGFSKARSVGRTQTVFLRVRAPGVFGQAARAVMARRAREDGKRVAAAAAASLLAPGFYGDGDATELIKPVSAHYTPSSPARPRRLLSPTRPPPPPTRPSTGAPTTHPRARTVKRL